MPVPSTPCSLSLTLLVFQDTNFSGYFANQVITNACASLAILNAVFNMSSSSVYVGPELENLKEFGQGMSSLDLGELLSNSDKVRPHSSAQMIRR